MMCKNCKFWTRTLDDFYGDCNHEKFVDAYTLDDEVPPVDGVMLIGDGGANFVTGEEFGCIHFEKKEDK